VKAEARQRRAGGNYTGTNPQSYLDMTIYDRCITRSLTAGFFPAIYGNGSQFVQTPDMVAIRYEMIHDTRLIPLDNRPRTNIRSFMGESRTLGRQHACCRDEELHRRHPQRQRPAL
jgi:hypothetical protein